MIIQMTISMSGGRYDDRTWPPAGVDFEVPDEEGQALINDCNAVFVRDSGEEVLAEPVPAPATEAKPSVTSAGPVQWETGPAPDPEPALEMPEPLPTASKKLWEHYALSQGGDPDDVVAKTKAELMREYGGRL